MKTVLKLTEYTTLVFQAHRVVWEDGAEKQKRPRYSMVFFFHADDDVVIRCVDGSDAFEPMTAKEILDKYIYGTVKDPKLKI